MRIAIPSEDNRALEGFVGEHFGRSPYYVLVDIEGGKIVNVKLVESGFAQHVPGEIPNFLKSLGVNLVIARGMGTRAKEFFKRLGIQVITGAHGRIKEVVEAYLKGELKSSLYEPKEKFRERSTDGALYP